MSFGGIAFVFFFVVFFFLCQLEAPTWISVISLVSACVFELIASEQFNTMKKRVEKLEKEMRERKDGADNE